MESEVTFLCRLLSQVISNFQIWSLGLPGVDSHWFFEWNHSTWKICLLFFAGVWLRRGHARALQGDGCVMWKLRSSKPLVDLELDTMLAETCFIAFLRFYPLGKNCLVYGGLWPVKVRCTTPTRWWSFYTQGHQWNALLHFNRTNIVLYV